MSITNQGNMYLYVPQGSIYFAGGSSLDRIEIANNPLLTPLDNLTIGVWVKRGSTNTASDSVIAHGGSNWGIVMDSVDPTKFAFNLDANTLTQSSTLDTNTWHHIVCTFDKSLASDNKKIYVDGEFDVSEDDTTSITYIDFPLVIGAINTTGDNGWQGYICDVRFYSGNTLSADEIKQLYNGINITNGLVAHWKFDDRRGTTLTDSINDLDGTLQSIPVWRDRDIRCWNSRWDESNYSITFESFIDACDRNYLMNNIVPQAVRELYNILGEPHFVDTTWASSNTLRIAPIGNYGLSGIRNSKTIGVRNASSTFINPETYGIKIEGMVL